MSIDLYFQNHLTGGYNRTFIPALCLLPRGVPRAGVEEVPRQPLLHWPGITFTVFEATPVLQLYRSQNLPFFHFHESTTKKFAMCIISLVQIWNK